MKFIYVAAVLLAIVAIVLPAQAYRCLPLGDDCTGLLVCCPKSTCSKKTGKCVKFREW